MSKVLVSVVMGSDSDLAVMNDAVGVLKDFNVPYEVDIVSAHRTPEKLFDFAKNAHERGVKVIIAGAGGAAHLPGMIASISPLPVIGVPIKSSNSIDGWDSVLSILQMPAGVPVAMISPGSSVTPRDISAMIAGMSAMSSRVLEACRASPLTKLSTSTSTGKGSAERCRIHGPNAAKVSRLLPRYHWLCAFCSVRAEMSLNTE